MASRSSDAFAAWVRSTIAPIAHAHGLTGSGPVFRRRDGANWIVFALERRRLDPFEAQEAAADPQVFFRMGVGVSVPAMRPAWRPGRDRPPGMHDMTMGSPSSALMPPDGEQWQVFDADDPAGQERLAVFVRDGLPKALAALGSTAARDLLEPKPCPRRAAREPEPGRRRGVARVGGRGGSPRRARRDRGRPRARPGAGRSRGDAADCTCRSRGVPGPGARHARRRTRPVATSRWVDPSHDPPTAPARAPTRQAARRPCVSPRVRETRGGDRPRRMGRRRGNRRRAPGGP